MIALFLATIAVALAVGGWIGVRLTDRLDDADADISRFVVSVPPHEWQHADD